ncbi:hypothetical protein DRO38_06135, partial [Candidatus Bathyarchaeota archaeon]
LIDKLPSWQFSPDIRLPYSEELLSRYEENLKEIKEFVKRILINFAEKRGFDYSLIDGIKIFFKDKGWALIRFSGTQKVLSTKIDAQFKEDFDLIAREIYSLLIKKSIVNLSLPYDNKDYFEKEIRPLLNKEELEGEGELKTDGGRKNKEYKIKGSEKVGDVTVNLRMRRDTKIERYALQHLRRGFLVVKEALMNKGLFTDWVGEEVCKKIKEINVDYFKHGDRRIVFKVTTDNPKIKPFVVKWVYRPGEARPINEQLQDMMEVYRRTEKLYGKDEVVVPSPGDWTDDTYTEGYLEGLERYELIEEFAKQKNSISKIARIEAIGLVRVWRATQDSSGKGMIFLDHHGRDVLFVKNDNGQYLAKFFDFESVEKKVSPAQMIFYYMKKSRTLFDSYRQAFYQGILEGLGEKEGVEFLEWALREEPDLPKLKEFLKKLQTGCGTLKSFGIRTERNRGTFQRAKANEGLWLKQASEVPLETRTIKRKKIIAKFIVDNENLPQGLWGYHFRDREGNLIIIMRSEYQDEAAYHEAREAAWINELQRRAGPNLSKEEISHQAHILASAEQSLQFAIRDESGNIIQPTPLHQEMLKRKTPTELQDIINEDRAEQHNLIRNYLGEEVFEKQKEYEGVVRGSSLQNIPFELPKKMPEDKVNTDFMDVGIRRKIIALSRRVLRGAQAVIWHSFFIFSNQRGKKDAQESNLSSAMGGDSGELYYRLLNLSGSQITQVLYPFSKIAKSFLRNRDLIILPSLMLFLGSTFSFSHSLLNYFLPPINAPPYLGSEIIEVSIEKLTHLFTHPLP